TRSTGASVGGDRSAAGVAADRDGARGDRRLRPEGSVAAARRAGRHDQVAPVRGSQDAAGEIAMDDARDALSDLDQMLADALDVQPSAGFTARVRQRIASEPMRVPIWHGWRIAVATAAAGVAIAAASVAMLSKRGQPAPQVLSARSLPVGPLRPADVRSSRSTL